MQRLTEVDLPKAAASDAVRRCKVAGGLPDLRRREYGDAGWAAAACNHTLSLLSRVLAQSTSQGILQLTCMMEPALPGLLASTIPHQVDNVSEITVAALLTLVRAHRLREAG